MAIIELVFDRAAVNPDRLHEDLAAALGAAFIGVSAGRGKVRVHVLDSLPAADRDRIGLLVAAHDPSQLTAAQQAEADRAALLERLRKPWAEWTAKDKDDVLRLMAERLLDDH